MAYIRQIQPDQPVADFSVTGALITIAGLSLDAADQQRDEPLRIEVRRDDSGAAVFGGDGAYIAHIDIPAAEYADATEDGPPVRLPLDPNRIVITLWPMA